MSELGYENAVEAIKSDQEAAIKDAANEICKLRTTAKTFREESPVGPLRATA
jgi:hypothetical protein